MTSLNDAQKSMSLRARRIEELIRIQNPELLDLFFTYQNEAIAARVLLDRDLQNLAIGAEILEVGGGILSLALQLASEGYRITTVEPVGDGFNGIAYIMEKFLSVAFDESIEFTLIKSPIEDCNFDKEFDFIFSINVMEHLLDPIGVMKQLHSYLLVGAKYRFLCPNYDFPYEPHFGKWIPKRRNGAFFLPASRAVSEQYSDPKGLYSSLNFLTLRKVESAANSLNIRIVAKRSAFYELLVRSLNDEGLQKRHKLLSKLVKSVGRLKILSLSRRLAPRFQPTMDVDVYRD